MLLFIEQFLNGIQFGVFLFLISAGLTLVLGIMNVVNLAHGSLYMLGAYFASTFFGMTGSLVVSLVLMIPVMLVVGIVIELVVLRTLYERDHMDQVLATFGLILFFNELVRLIWGVEVATMDVTFTEVNILPFLLSAIFGYLGFGPKTVKGATMM